MVIVGFGFYNEISAGIEKSLPFTYLSKSQGLSLAIISFTMSLVLIALEKEREGRKNEDSTNLLTKKFLDHAGLCMPYHEGEFYSLLPLQIQNAKNNVDITHLGLKPPSMRNGEPEKNYFDRIKDIYSKSNAKIRRVERFSNLKKDWIEGLVKTFRNNTKFSLAIYQDGSNEELPHALSVCRVDENYAWIIALSEHESTANYRDLLLTGKESVLLFKDYFNKRLWDRSVIIIENGKVTDEWAVIKKQLEK